MVVIELSVGGSSLPLYVGFDGWPGTIGIVLVQKKKEVHLYVYGAN